MSWVHNFPPPKDGNYIVKVGSLSRRYDYKSAENLWYDGGMRVRLPDGYSWWDEYGFTKRKKSLNLNLRFLINK